MASFSACSLFTNDAYKEQGAKQEFNGMMFDPDDDDDDVADPDYNFSSDDTSEDEVVEYEKDNKRKKKIFARKSKGMVPTVNNDLTEITTLENNSDKILPGITDCNEEKEVDKNTEYIENQGEKSENIDRFEIIDHQQKHDTDIDQEKIHFFQSTSPENHQEERWREKEQIENVDENTANNNTAVTDNNQQDRENHQEVEQDGNINENNKKKKRRPRTLKERQVNERAKHPLIQVLECCSKKCFSEFSDTQRRQLHSEFWELNRDGRKLWINSHVSEMLAKRKLQDTRRTYTRSYKLPVLKESGKSTFPVCQQFFLKTLGFQSTSVIDHTLKCCKDEHGNQRLTPLPDQRGRHAPKNKKDLTDLREHIKSYKPIPSHYKREHAPNRLYLPSDLTIKIMHLDYNKKFFQNPVGYELYRKTLDEMNIAFYNVHSVKCGFCIKVDMDPTPENLADKEVHLNEIWKQKINPFIRLTNIPHLMAVFLVTIATLTVVPATNALNTFCPNGCVCNDETLIVQCEKSKLDVLPIALNPSIQRLVLRNNKIKTVDAAFQFYGELQYVDLSSNHLVNIPTHCFTNQKKLQELHLNRNKISSIRNVTFQGLKSLTVLNLRENFLEVLTRGLFTVLPKLEELNLGQNRISKIDPLAFEGMTSLRILYLDDNQLMSIPTASFAPLGSLAELHVGLNVFTVLSDDAFAGLGKLTVLDIGGAGLVNISDGAFNGLSGLRNLDLADNHLHVIPTKQLAKLTRLEELSIGQNDFVSIKSDSFRDLANLRHLDITSAGSLERVEQGAFSTNVNLESIILASNKKLNIIEDGALTGLPKLRRLVLRENSLELISESTVAWNELRALELSDNPLNCDCNLLWLRSLVAERNMTSVQCATPLSVRDRSLKSLSPEEMGCAFHDPHQQAILGAVCVSGVALLAGLSLLLYRYRRRVRDAFKDYKWNKRAISRKEHEYQKTFSDDEYMVRSAAAAAAVHQQHPNHLAAPPSLKPIPVTEL